MHMCVHIYIYNINISRSVSLSLSMSLSLALSLSLSLSLYGRGSKPRVVAGPPSSVTSLCCGRLFLTLCRGFLAAMIKHITSRYRFVFWEVVAEGVVAEHPCLLQTYVAKWPPKPVANPVLWIRCRVLYMYIYVYIIISLSLSMCVYVYGIYVYVRSYV